MIHNGTKSHTVRVPQITKSGYDGAWGGDEFVARIKDKLGIRVKGRKLVESRETFQLREPEVSYPDGFDTKNDNIEAENTIFGALILIFQYDSLAQPHHTLFYTHYNDGLTLFQGAKLSKQNANKDEIGFLSDLIGETISISIFENGLKLIALGHGGTFCFIEYFMLGRIFQKAEVET